MIIVGGEHVFSPWILFKKFKGYVDGLINNFHSDYQINFTFGGYYSILAILDSIKPKIDNDSWILLPSYLCPTILKPFKVRGIQYKFYRVDDDLFIDTDQLISIIDNNVKAVFFIDYFGASQMGRLQPVIDILKKSRITIIQDVVQCLNIRKECLFGDYIFNSFRKFFPFEGSILLSKEKMNVDFGNKRNRYIVYKRIGQLLRYVHLKYGLISNKSFLNFLKKAEEHYYNEEIMKMPSFNRKQLNKIDFSSVERDQIYYFGRLYNFFKDNVPGLLKNNAFIPLGFVLKIEDRDTVRNQLFSNNIFPPIHWVLSNEIDERLFPESVLLSKTILTIPLIGLTEKKFEYLFGNIINSLKNESISESIGIIGCRKTSQMEK